VNTRNRPTKILYLITDLKLGGAQTVLLHILGHLDKNRFQPSVACLFGGDLPVGDNLRSMGITVTDLGMTNWWRLDSLWRLYRLLRREAPIILHSSLFHANLAARLVGRLARTPVIITWRQNISLGSPIRESINRLTGWMDDHVVAVSGLTRLAELKLAGRPKNKVSVIYNCIDTDRFKPRENNVRAQMRTSLNLPHEAFVCGWVGRLHPQKGIPVLLNAFDPVLAKIPEAKLVLIGEGELSNDLKTQAQSLGLSRSVLFTGARTDIPDALAAMDIFILPSNWEGLPLALLEAMSAGLPTVAARVGGIPEVVIEGQTGLLVPPEDPQALTAAIVRLGQDKNMRHRMGQAGRKRVIEHFSAGPITKSLEALYENLESTKGGPG